MMKTVETVFIHPVGASTPLKRGVNEMEFAPRRDGACTALRGVETMT